DVFSYGVLIRTGHTRLCATPSTYTNTPPLASSDLCAFFPVGDNISQAQCNSRRGGSLPPRFLDSRRDGRHDNEANNSLGWRPSPLVTGGGLNLDSRLARELESATLDPSDGISHSTSHLGLAENSTILQALMDKGYIKRRSWGLDTGFSNPKSPRRGSLVFGGYDSQRDFQHPWHQYAINASGGQLDGNKCSLSVVISELRFTINGRSRTLLEGPLKGCIEPYDNLFRLPLAQLERLRSHIEHPASLSFPRFSGNPRILIAEPGLIYETSRSLNASLDIKFENGFSVNIPSDEFEKPLRGLDINGSPTVNHTLREIQVLQSPADGNTIVLGRAFLSQAYLSVDYDTRTFHLARRGSPEKLGFPVPGEIYQAWIYAEQRGLVVIGLILGQAHICFIILW
ncbi:hypothetical protein QBC37DRAFT_454159, partial [Rhypophila decipiens]